MTDNLLSIFDPMNVEQPEEQPDQNLAQEILEAKLDQILKQEEEALLQASDFIGYQVDRIRKAQANAGICKQTIAQAQANKKGWERETEFRRWAIQQSLEYLKAKGLLDKPQLTGPDYKVSVSQRQGGLEVSDDLQEFLEQLQEKFVLLVSDLIFEMLEKSTPEVELPTSDEEAKTHNTNFQDIVLQANDLGLTAALWGVLKIDVAVSLDKAEVKRKLGSLKTEAKHFSVSKNPSLTAKI